MITCLWYAIKFFFARNNLVNHLFQFSDPRSVRGKDEADLIHPIHPILMTHPPILMTHPQILMTHRFHRHRHHPTAHLLQSRKPTLVTQM